MTAESRDLARRSAAVALRVVVAAAALLFLARGVAWGEVARTLRGASPGLLVGVVALNAVMMVLKSARLRLLLERRASFAACLLAKLTASAINNVAPLRGGDLARIWMLERHAGISKSVAAVIAVVENLLEVGALAALAVVAAAALPGQRWAAGAAPALLAVALVSLLLMRRAGRDGGPPLLPPAPGEGGLRRRLRALRRRIAPAVRALRRPGTAATAAGLSFAAWGIETAMVLLCARAIHVPMRLPLAVLALLGINAAMVLPSLPAGMGAFEAAATLVLTLSGVGKEQAVAFAVLYHLVQVVPVTIAGALVVSRVGLTLGGLPARRWDGAR